MGKMGFRLELNRRSVMVPGTVSGTSRGIRAENPDKVATRPIRAIPNSVSS